MSRAYSANAEQHVGSESKLPAPGTMVENPTENDVLFGRGAPYSRWKGNVQFRAVVALRKEEYASVRRDRKNKIAREIMSEIFWKRQGRFLMKASYAATGETNASGTDHWEVASEGFILAKVKQALREKQKQTESEVEGKVAAGKRRSSQTTSPSQKRPREDGPKTRQATTTKELYAKRYGEDSHDSEHKQSEPGPSISHHHGPRAVNQPPSREDVASPARRPSDMIQWADRGMQMFHNPDARRHEEMETGNLSFQQLPERQGGAEASYASTRSSLLGAVALLREHAFERESREHLQLLHTPLSTRRSELRIPDRHLESISSETHRLNSFLVQPPSPFQNPRRDILPPYLTSRYSSSIDRSLLSEAGLSVAHEAHLRNQETLRRLRSEELWLRQQLSREHSRNQDSDSSDDSR